MLITCAHCEEEIETERYLETTDNEIKFCSRYCYTWYVVEHEFDLVADLLIMNGEVYWNEEKDS